MVVEGAGSKANAAICIELIAQPVEPSLDPANECLVRMLLEAEMIEETIQSRHRSTQLPAGLGQEKKSSMKRL